jgi:hypothetical protein
MACERVRGSRPEGARIKATGSLGMQSFRGPHTSRLCAQARWRSGALRLPTPAMAKGRHVRGRIGSLPALTASGGGDTGGRGRSIGGGGGGRAGEGGRGGEDPEEQRRGSMQHAAAVLLALGLASSAAWCAPAAMAASAPPAPPPPHGAAAASSGRGSSHAAATSSPDDPRDAPSAPSSSLLPSPGSSAEGVGLGACSEDVVRLKRLQREVFAGMVELRQRLEELEAKEGEEEDTFIPFEGAGVAGTWAFSL